MDKWKEWGSRGSGFRKCWDNPRGFTIAPGCDIPVTASLENIDAYMRAARKCAKYPVHPSNWE